jgi:hypothetical protein
MKPRKPKTSEPSLRDKLSERFVFALESDFETHQSEVIKSLREKHIDRYADLIVRLIAAREPEQKPEGFAAANSLHDVGRRLLQQVGLPEPLDEQIAQAIEENDKFISALEAIRDSALQFEELTNGNAAPIGTG